MLVAIFQTFVDRLEHARDDDTLCNAMSVITGAFGLTGFAYVDARQPASDLPPYVTTYPADWVQRYVSRRYDKIDPVLARTCSTVMPFLWNDRTAGSRASREQLEFFDEARQFGITCGFSVPIHDCRGGVTSLTFASDRPAEVLEQTAYAHRHTLHLAAMYFDIHARQKLGATIDLDSSGLSRREVACLQWTACGKTTWDIGEILGISRSGVAWHLRSARRKLGAATLSQAVAAGLKRKLIEL
jgi:LuxR family transcriptional regulator, activator of conjugal transfer of Ti plasmids